MLVYKVILNLVLLVQIVANGQQEESLVRLKPFCMKELRDVLENCTEEDFRQQPRRKNNGIFIQYCSGGSWYYLCGQGIAWTPTLATVACRQLGYSDHGKIILTYNFYSLKRPMCRSQLLLFNTLR